MMIVATNFSPHYGNPPDHRGQSPAVWKRAIEKILAGQIDITPELADELQNRVDALKSLLNLKSGKAAAKFQNDGHAGSRARPRKYRLMGRGRFHSAITANMTSSNCRRRPRKPLETTRRIWEADASQPTETLQSKNIWRC